MLRSAALALLGLLLVGGIVASLPAPQESTQAGVELRKVQMRLYPRTEDRDVVWVFGAQKIAFDPSKSESTLSNLEQGKRLIRGKLDMTLETRSLTIDQNDTIRTNVVTLSIPKVCTTFTFGEEGNPRAVSIDHNSGFSGPNVRYQDATTRLTARSVESDFALKNLRMPGARFKGDLDATSTCKNGKIVPSGGSS